MKKCGFKAFITSFCLSMFAIFFANTIFATPKSNTSSKVVPSKNIALFFQSQPKAASNPAGKVKKIALNISPAKIPQNTTNQATNGIPLIYTDQNIATQKIIENYADFIQKPVEVEIKKPETINQELVYSHQQDSASYKTASAPNIPIIKNDELIFDGTAQVTDTKELTTKVAQASSATFNSKTSEIKEAPKQEVVEVKKQTPWIDIKEEKIETQPVDNTWSVAKGSPHPKNKLMAPKEEKEEKKPLRNILIPLPEIEGNEPPQIVDEKKDIVIIKKEEPKAKEDNTIIKNITSLFSKTSKKVEEETKEIIEGISNKAKEMSNKSLVQTKKATAKKEILPAEIRLVFAPNRAEISGQTLNWLNAFAQKSKQENVGLEIRADGTSTPQVQQKRLNLIYNILSAKNVDPKRVKTTFTNRDPNSFIIRVLKLNQPGKINDNDYRKYYQQQKPNGIDY